MPALENSSNLWGDTACRGNAQVDALTPHQTKQTWIVDNGNITTCVNELDSWRRINRQQCVVRAGLHDHTGVPSNRPANVPQPNVRWEQARKLRQ
jgi:hypothetical protein